MGLLPRENTSLLPVLLSDAVQLSLKLDDLFESLVGGIGRNLASVDHQRRHLIEIQILGQFDRCFHLSTNYRSRGAGCDFYRIQARLDHCAVQGERGAIRGSQSILAGKNRRSLLEEGVATPLLGYADAIC